MMASRRLPALRQRVGPRTPAGFTLLELLVVLGIFSMLSLLAYGGLDSVLRSRATVEAALGRTAAMQKAYMRLRDDFQQLRNRPVRNAYGTDAEPALLLALDHRVEFTRGGWRNPLSHARSTLERVAYGLDQDERLVRESWRVLDRGPDSEPVRIALLKGVRRLDWRFMDAQSQWQEQWPPSAFTGNPADAPLPRAVEITLDTADWGEIRFLFEAQ